MNSFTPTPPEFRELISAIRNEASAGRQDEGIQLRELVRAIREEALAGRNEESKEDRGKARRERITITLLIVNVIVMWIQVHEMRRTYDPISAQANAMKTAATAATDQTKQAADATTEAERAWVGPTNAAIGPAPEQGKPTQGAAPPVVGKDMLITVAYQNSGHEPGLHYHATGDVYVFRLRKAAFTDVDKWITTGMQSCETSPLPAGGSVIYPSTGALSGGYSYQIQAENKPYSKGATVYVQGCFQYRTFDMDKHSYFCYFYDPNRTRPEALNICDNGHDAN